MLSVIVVTLACSFHVSGLFRVSENRVCEEFKAVTLNRTLLPSHRATDEKIFNCKEFNQLDESWNLSARASFFLPSQPQLLTPKAFTTCFSKCALPLASFKNGCASSCFAVGLFKRGFVRGEKKRDEPKKGTSTVFQGPDGGIDRQNRGIREASLLSERAAASIFASKAISVAQEKVSNR